MKNRSLLIFVLLLSTFSFAQIQQRIHQSDGSILQLPLTEIDSINFSLSPARMYIHRADSAAKNISISEIDSATFSGFDFGDAKLISLMGQVMNEEGSPLFGVEVQVGNRMFNSDSNGVFYFPEAPVLENLGYVKAIKAGYFPGLRSFVPTEGTNRVEIRLLRQNIAGTFNAVSGGTVQAEGVNIIFPAGGITKNGSAYSGTVRVALNYINPESPDFDTEMPGNLLGVMNGNLRGLISYGMFAGELTDEAGNKLELAPGALAQVRFPLSQGLLATAPETIDFWHFDEQTGIWSHEGLATKQGNEYLASVSHFSFWNCDIPFPAVLLRGRVLDEDGGGLPGAKVTLVSTSRGSASDITSSEGYFGGYVPANESLTMRISVRCGINGDYQDLHTETIGPFTFSETIPAVQISSGTTTRLSGRVVDCDTIAVATGYVVVGANAHFADSLGRFSLFACGDSISLRAFSAIPWAAGQLTTVVLSEDSIHLGNLQVCGQSSDLLTDIDGNSYTTVVIGTQEWMAENLRTSRYRDGSEIPNVTDDTSWANLSSGAWCHYLNSADSGAIYGKLYNWFTVSDPRGLCPAGWHVPTDAEWTVLTDFLGGYQTAGTKMKSTYGWIPDQGQNGNGTNESGFTGLPGGSRYYGDGTFSSVGGNGFWWSSSEYGAFNAWTRFLYYDGGSANRNTSNKRDGFSLRCLRD